MKKIILIFFISICSYVNAISAQNYIVYDIDSKRVLMGNNIHSVRLIASTTKILTCIIALENGNLEDQIKIDNEVLKTTGSSIYLSLGENISLRDLLYGMMLRSGNDAALAVANYISGNMEDFAKLMNEYALNLGMHDSSFINSTGLENSEGVGNISSAYDMALLTSYAMKNSEFQKIFKTKNYSCKSDIKTYNWENKNKLLKNNFIIGGKTGYTKKAKRTLVTVGNINGSKVVIVTLNDSDDWEDHMDIYNILMNNYNYVKIIDKNNLNIYENLFNLDYNFYAKKDFYYGLFNDDKYEVKYFLYDNSYKDEVGYFSILVNNDEVYKDKIYLKEKRSNFFKRLFNKIWPFK